MYRCVDLHTVKIQMIFSIIEVISRGYVISLYGQYFIDHITYFDIKSPVFKQVFNLCKLISYINVCGILCSYSELRAILC